jgi:short-subunit dehydrogenase
LPALSAFSHAVITGASSGIGAEMARALAAPGRRLTLIARRADVLETVAADCRAAGATVDALPIDVADTAALGAALARADAASPIDLLIANAALGGAAYLSGRRGEDPARALAIANVNFAGLVGTVAPLAPAMAARGRGAVVIVGSMTARVALPHCPSYGASKAGATYYAHALRRLLRASGVTVTLATLGYVDTAMSDGLSRPFLMRADDVARRVLAAAATAKAEIAIPWQLDVATRLNGVLPRVVVDAVLALSLRGLR